MTQDEQDPGRQTVLHTERRGIRSGIVFVECLAVLAIIAFVLIQVMTERTRLEAAIADESERLQDLVAENTGQLFTQLEQVLTSLAVELRSEPVPLSQEALRSLKEQVSASRRGQAFIENIFIVDTLGNVIIDAGELPFPIDNLSEHPVFLEQVRMDRVRLFFDASPGITPFDPEGQAALYASVPWFDKSGDFGGVVAAALSPEALAFWFDRLRPFPDDVIGLARTDGEILLRNPYLLDPGDGMLLDPYGTAARSVTHVQTQQAYREIQGPYGIERLIAHRKVRNFPVVAYTGLALEPRFGSWAHRAWVHALWGVVALVLVIGSGQLWRSGIRSRERENALQVARLNGLVRASADLIACTSVADVMQTLADLSRELIPCRHARVDMESGPGLAEREFAVSGERSLRGESPCAGYSPTITSPLLNRDQMSIGEVVLTNPQTSVFSVDDQALLNELAQVASLVTQKIQTELVSRQSRIELETVLNSISEAVCHLDHEWKFSYVNDYAAFLLDSTSEGLLGQCVWEFIPSVRNSYVQTQCHYAAEHQQSVEFEYFSVRLNGWFHFRVFPDQRGLTIYFQDVSDRKVRDEHQRQTVRLESMVRLAGSIADDFHGLLNKIQYGAQHMADLLKLQPELHQQALQVASQARQGIQLTRPLRVFARNQPLAPERVDPAVVLRSHRDRLIQSIPKGAVDLQICVVPEKDPWFVNIDVPLFLEAVQSVCLNAYEAMGDGGMVMLLVAHAVLEPYETASLGHIAPGDYVMITVADSGAGMTHTELELAFDPFYTTKTALGRTGLGLSLVHGFVKQSGGAVRIHSHPGEGTSVQMYLPRAHVISPL